MDLRGIAGAGRRAEIAVHVGVGKPARGIVGIACGRVLHLLHGRLEARQPAGVLREGRDVHADAGRAAGLGMDGSGGEAKGGNAG